MPITKGCGYEGDIYLSFLPVQLCLKLALLGDILGCIVVQMELPVLHVGEGKYGTNWLSLKFPDLDIGRDLTEEEEKLCERLRSLIEVKLEQRLGKDKGRMIEQSSKLYEVRVNSGWHLCSKIRRDILCTSAWCLPLILHFSLRIDPGMVCVVLRPGKRDVRKHMLHHTSPQFLSYRPGALLENHSQHRRAPLLPISVATCEIALQFKPLAPRKWLPLQCLPSVSFLRPMGLCFVCISFILGGYFILLLASKKFHLH